VTADDRPAPTGQPTGVARGRPDPVELPIRRNRFSLPALLVAGGALVALPLAVAVAIAATVVTSASSVAGVLVGLVVPLALLGFAVGVARPLIAGRRTVLVLRADALVIVDRTLFRTTEGIPRPAVSGAWIGDAVDGWLAGRDPEGEVSIAPDDEPVDLLLSFDELVVLDHARTRVSRPKGEHRSSLPHPERPIGHLWVPLADPDGARAKLAAWLPSPPREAPLGTPTPDLA
jgi:hypothetical protein